MWAVAIHGVSSCRVGSVVVIVTCGLSVSSFQDGGSGSSRDYLIRHKLLGYKSFEFSKRYRAIFRVGKVGSGKQLHAVADDKDPHVL